MLWKIMILLSLIISILDYLLIRGASILKTPRERRIEDEEQNQKIQEYLTKKEEKLNQKKLKKERKLRLKYEKINNRRKTKCGKRNRKNS